MNKKNGYSEKLNIGYCIKSSKKYMEDWKNWMTEWTEIRTTENREYFAAVKAIFYEKNHPRMDLKKAKTN